MASRLNKQVDRFYSYMDDPEALGTRRVETRLGGRELLVLPTTRDDSRGAEAFTGAGHDGLRYFDHPGGAGRVLRVADGVVGGDANHHRRHPSYIS